MYKRNLLNPGDYVLAVPVGVHLTLEYNTSGNLARVYTGFEFNRVDETKKLMIPLIQNDTVPSKIHVVNGKTWITGVLYTGKVLSNPGTLPDSVIDDYVKLYLSNPEHFNFFAGTIESTAVPYKGANQMTQALTIDKFHLLPGRIVPANISETVFNEWLSSDRFPFVNSVISDCIIFRKDSILYESLELSQFVVDHVERFVDDNGFIKGRVYNTYNNTPIIYDYSDIVRMRICSNTLLILDANNQPVHAKYIGSKKHNSLSNQLTCRFCGKSFVIPNTGLVQCPNLHCTSRLFSKVIQFLSVLNLEIPDKSVILKWISSKAIICIPDILVLEDYKRIKINTTIADILRALVSVKLIPNPEIFTLFANACNNAVDSVRYYAQNPDGISIDLNLHHPDTNKLRTWLSDACNVSDLITVLDSPQLVLHKSNRKFNGAPIFRDKLICITGDFIHGSISDILAILSSYSANVTTVYQSTVDCVLVGGKQENVNGKFIASAHAENIPVMDESEFFAAYDIDTDLKNNFLLS